MVAFAGSATRKSSRSWRSNSSAHRPWQLHACSYRIGRAIEGTELPAPSIQPNVTVYRDELTGTLLAAQMGGKGETTILPQIVALPRTGAVETAVSGSDSQSLRDFLERFDLG